MHALMIINNKEKGPIGKCILQNNMQKHFMISGARKPESTAASWTPQSLKDRWNTRSALLSPLTLDAWWDWASAAVGAGEAVGGSGVFSTVKAALRSSEHWAQLRALELHWKCIDTWALGASSDMAWWGLKLTWAFLSAVRSHEEKSLSSRDGPEEQCKELLELPLELKASSLVLSMIPFCKV